jgi:hypothetical protein
MVVWREMVSAAKASTIHDNDPKFHDDSPERQWSTLSCGGVDFNPPRGCSAQQREPINITVSMY